MSVKKVVIFASGQGSNAKQIIDYFKNRDDVKIAHVLSNNIRAKVLKTAHEMETSALHFDRDAFYETNEVLNVLKDTNPDLIVLAGFMWKVPEKILRAFPNKIVNIHPALLPKYGGKGMYGDNVHKAVLHKKETETGISIHYVNAEYDEGELIAQFKTEISPEDNLESLVEKVKKLEHYNYPRVIDTLLFSET